MDSKNIQEVKLAGLCERQDGVDFSLGERMDGNTMLKHSKFTIANRKCKSKVRFGEILLGEFQTR